MQHTILLSDGVYHRRVYVHVMMPSLWQERIHKRTMQQVGLERSNTHGIIWSVLTQLVTFKERRTVICV